MPDNPTGATPLSAEEIAFVERNAATIARLPDGVAATYASWLHIVRKLEAHIDSLSSSLHATREVVEAGREMAKTWGSVTQQGQRDYANFFKALANLDQTGSES